MKRENRLYSIQRQTFADKGKSNTRYLIPTFELTKIISRKKKSEQKN